MIGRYRIVRGLRSAGDPLPEGQRQDTRKHTRHILRPSAALVSHFLQQPSDSGFALFRAGYLGLLEERFRLDRTPFDILCEAAHSSELFLGCNCPTAKQPDVRRCHTYLALGFLAERYPELPVRWP
jgi:hypothetical protein